MTTQAELEKIIAAFAREIGSSFRKRDANSNLGMGGYYYVSGKKGPFDCFQVSVSSDDGNLVRVLASSVDTNDSSELEENWEGATSELAVYLAEANRAVRRWQDRPGASDDGGPQGKAMIDHIRKTRRTTLIVCIALTTCIALVTLITFA